jgi:osmotically-inducible protein OsmY
MKLVRNLFLAVITLIGFSFITADAQSFAASKPERSLNEQVYRQLKGLVNANVFDFIDWEINGNTVTLTGKVYSLGTRRNAAARVKDIAGITEVINNIQELPPSPYDDRIREQAYAEFTSRGPAQYFGYPDPDVRIIVENGRLTLEGYVTKKGHSDTLNILANSIPGVFTVTNNLRIGERRF